MNKKNATLVLIALLAFTVLAWGGTIKGQVEDKTAYAQHMEKAEMLEEKGIYIDALEHYKKALEISPQNYDLVIKIADINLNLRDINGFVAYCDQAIQMDAKNPTPYIKKANYFMSKSQYHEAIEILTLAQQEIKDNEEINQLQKKLSTTYIEKYAALGNINDWHVQEKINLVVVKDTDDEKWGMTAKDGSNRIRMIYDYIGAYDKESGVIPCCSAGEYYYIDVEGNKKLVGDKSYQFLGSFGCGLAPAQRDDLYGYIDTDFTEQQFEYEYAGAFANNIAAVQKGGKWALLNTKLKNITEYEYDEILMDSYGYCSMFDVIVAKQGEKYYFLNHKGEKITETSFDAVSIPASNDGYIAVKQGELWGFADVSGNIVIEPQYEEAKSFSKGLAPVKVLDKWGYIDTEGTVVIEPKYLDAGVFSSDGSAPVKKSIAWNFIVLCEYDD